MSRGIFFRGDSRKYTRVFDVGFQSDTNNTFGQPLMRFPEVPVMANGAIVGSTVNRDVAPDVHPGKVVCFTKDFFAASLFPLDGSTRTYIYAMDLDTRYILNTQQCQLEYVQSIAHRLTAPGVAEALWPMFGQERAIPNVNPNEIICSVEVTRRQNVGTGFTGGEFTIRGIVENEEYFGFGQPGGQADKVLAAMRTLQGKGTHRMPSQACGIVASTSS